MNSNSLVHLDLRSTTCRKEGADSVFKALQRNQTVTCLHIGNNAGLYRNILLGKSIADIEKCLITNMTLIFLDLNGAAIGNEGLKYVTNGLINCRFVNVLNLASNSLDGMSAKYISKILIETQIKRLDLSQNPLGNNFIVEFERETRDKQFIITHLYLNSCEFLGHQMYKLFESLKRALCLEYLELDEAKYKEKDISYLHGFLNGNNTLRHLSCSKCYFGDIGLKAISVNITNFSMLEYINVSNNTITSAGIIVFSERLIETMNHHLKYLDFSHNLIDVLYFSK